MNVARAHLGTSPWPPFGRREFWCIDTIPIEIAESFATPTSEFAMPL